MVPKTIAIDVDDTCGDLKNAIADLIAEINNCPRPDPEEFTAYFAATELFDIPSDVLQRNFVEKETMLHYPVLDGVVDTVEKLVNWGYRIEFVTARGWWVRAYEVTEKWLNKSGIYFDKITIVPSDKTKAEATESTDNIDLFIDDLYENCVDMIASGRVRKALLVDQPWNRDIDLSDNPQIVRISKFNELIDHLD